MKEFIDSSVFLGMHSMDEQTRIICKNFFVNKLKNNSKIFFHLEQVGICDSVIWNFSTEKQNAYYPFMDFLHTIMQFEYVKFSEADLLKAIHIDKDIKNVSDRLIISSVDNYGGKLYTINQSIVHKHNVVTEIPYLKEKELYFPEKIEKMYAESLRLRIPLKGIIPPLVTPLDENNNVCKKSVEKLINYLSPFSVAFMPTLSSGEGWALNTKQFIDMLTYTVEFSKLPVIAGVEQKTTKEVIERAKIAKEIGVNGIIVTTPFVAGISQSDIYMHYKQIVEAVDMPVWIYNEKEISGTEIQLDTIEKISRLKNIAGIKEASGSISFYHSFKALPLNMPVYQGWEHLCFKSKNVDGYILPLSNIDPELCKEMFDNPTLENQKRINEQVKKYNLADSNWYKELKKELYKRKIISTDNLVINEKNI